MGAIFDLLEHFLSKCDSPSIGKDRKVINHLHGCVKLGKLR